jgi:DNA-binding NarL/FixJ family response regulator
MIQVLIAVSDPIAELGLRAVLDDADDTRAALFDPDAGDIPTAVAEHEPNVLLLDVKHRRADAGLIPGLCADHPNLHVLVLVDHSADECGIRHLLSVGGRAKLAPEALARVDDCCLTSLRQMALGCLAAGSTPESVLSAVRAVSRGEIAAAPWLTTVAASLAGGTDEQGHAPISARELEVMALLAEGLSNKQIARQMEIREQTVKNHVGHLMEKLGVASRLEAGLLAAKQHLTLTDE